MEEGLGAHAGGRLAGKVAIVTGAGHVEGPGIGTGRAAAILLARHGAGVVLVDVDRRRAEATLDEIRAAGGHAVVVVGDVTDPVDCGRMTQAALDELGRLDVLVNNVGISVPGTVVDLAAEAWGRMVEVNLTSAYRVSKHAIPAMATSGGGSIVNISSIGALRSIGSVGYSAAKGGIISLSREMAAQHGGQGIRVNVVVPGVVETPQFRRASSLRGADSADLLEAARTVEPLGRTTRGTGWDIGYAVLFFASDESSWITGQVLTVDGGSSVVMPEVAAASATGLALP